ncbi:hypothetical protein CLOSTMETH_03555 [[Clostridium] methylpentosum DSM 5476]|uniref:Uncharacterized protein n=1 Tax=[Clostridium] methylpentosum DSM 5476 TaxID=537013 RepID=C0EI60_9FIRM|nr:hypothetical protein CLOSTMETH_03555 [[Clostridium] methylpentosum DSM 5476]
MFFKNTPPSQKAVQVCQEAINVTRKRKKHADFSFASFLTSLFSTHWNSLKRSKTDT